MPLPQSLFLLSQHQQLKRDKSSSLEFDQRFEHPGRTSASATHRAFSFACVGAAMANETWKFVLAKSKQAMKQARYQRRGCAHEGDAATGGGTPCARGRHAMEPERRRHQFQPLRALRARAPRQAGPRNTTQESSKFFILAPFHNRSRMLFVQIHFSRAPDRLKLTDLHF